MKIKRLLSVLLVLVLLLALLPTTVFAAKAEEDDFEPVLNYHDIDYSADSPTKTGSLGPKSSAYANGDSTPLPEAYSSVEAGYISKVKDQGGYGTCWCFGATNASEASLIKKGAFDNTLDLSEMQLSFFMYNKKTDPLGNFTGDYTSPASGNEYYEQGGNDFFTMWALASWTNGALESTMPYSLMGQSLTSDYAYSYDVAHLSNAYIIPYSNGSNIKEIKQAVRDYGATTISYYAYKVNGKYCNEHYSSYYAEDDGSNHLVSVVGWNDNYPAEYFSDANGNHPSKNGAWLIKNSWGYESFLTNGTADYTDDSTNRSYDTCGYFWLSYYEGSIQSEDCFVYDFDTTDKYEFNYQYDGSCGTSYVNKTSGSKYGAYYTINGAEREAVKAIGLGFYSPNVGYSIELYKNPTTSNRPESGTKLLSSPITGTTTYEGYYSIPVSESPVLDKGDTLAIVVKLTTSADVAVDASSSYSWIKFTSSTTNDRTFSMSSYSTTSSKPSGYSFRVKALTKSVNDPMVKISGDSTVQSESGKSLTLTASVTPSTADALTYNWELSAGATDYVDMVTDGNKATITAKDGLTSSKNITLTCSVEGYETATKAITVQPVADKLKIYIGGVDYTGGTYTRQISGLSKRSTICTVTPKLEPSGSTPSVSLSTSNKTYFSVSGKNVTVRRVPSSDQTTTITVKSSDGKYTETFKVTLTKKTTTITISGNSTVEAGSQIQLSAAVNPSQTVTWSSSKETVATVNSSSGLVTGVAAGTATITAKAADGTTATKSITVTAKKVSVTGVNVTGSTSVYIGSSINLTANVTPSDATNKEVTWSSGDTSIATVDTNGKVTGKAAGTVTIKATSKDDNTKYGELQITVNPVLVSGINVSGNDSVLVGKTTTLSATVSPTNATNKNVTWSSGDTDIATVNSSTGVVTGVGKGSVTITATANDGTEVKGTKTITVKQPVTSIVVSGATNVDVGSSITLSAAVNPDNANDKSVTWSSSSTTYATVNSSTGEVTGVKAGNVTITATANDGSGVKGTYAVTVIQPEVKVTSISVSGSSSVNKGSKITLTATVSPTNATNKNVKWSSGDTNIATVNETTGEVTGVAAGSVTITATAQDGSNVKGTKQITVTSDPVKATSVDIYNGSTKVTGSTLSFSTKKLSKGSVLVDLDAIVNPSGASQSVTWSAANSYVKVDANGKVTLNTTVLLLSRSVKITAKANDGSGKTATVTIKLSR